MRTRLWASPVRIADACCAALCCWLQVLGEDLKLVLGQQDRLERGSDTWANPVSYDKLGEWNMHMNGRRLTESLFQKMGSQLMVAAAGHSESSLAVVSRDVAAESPSCFTATTAGRQRPRIQQTGPTHCLLTVTVCCCLLLQLCATAAGAMEWPVAACLTAPPALAAARRQPSP